VIWVKASPQEHMDRVQAQGDLRPMAGNPEAMTQLRTILRSREALYRQAHAEFDTSRKDVQAAARDLADLIRARGFISDCES
jgi:XRE family aerobic/anaerobic benzoate catabolism transcriptional regulator